MQQRPMGKSGLWVSRMALGTMTWGRDTDEHEARDQWKTFQEAGGTFIDTADVYAEGASEEIVGMLLDETGTRDQMVLATKAVSRPRTPRRFDASRGHLLRTLEGSLRRLGTDYVDVWYLHAWDPATPVAETLAAADDAVRSGKVRYVGISNYSGLQLARAATWQQALPERTELIATQMEYSLVQRGIERELVPAAANLGLGIVPWSPLGRGVLTGKYRYGTPSDSRAASQHFGAFVSEYLDDRSRRIVDAVCTAAEGLDVSPVEVAMAWVRDRAGVVAPISGARTVAQLRTVLDSQHLEFPDEIRSVLDEVSGIELGYPEYGWNQLKR